MIPRTLAVVVVALLVTGAATPVVADATSTVPSQHHEPGFHPMKAKTASASAAPSIEVAAGIPPDWTRQQDPKSGVIFFKPSDAPSAREAVLAVFPAVNFSGTAEQYHVQTLTTALNGMHLLEPVRQGTVGAFLVTSAHYQTAQGGNLRFVLYTAQWGTRAQAAMFGTSRDDLFLKNEPVVRLAMAGASIPGPANATPMVANPPALPAPEAGGFAGENVSHFQGVPAESRAPANVSADTGDTVPLLNYDEPANFYRGGDPNCREYFSNEANYTLCVYPFHPFTGDIVAQFQQTLLRDRIDPRYREEPLAGQPVFGNNSMPGATAVVDARFHEAKVGQPNERLRILIVAGNWAALVDIVAPNAYCWNRVSPAATAMLRTLHVDRKQAPPSLAAAPNPASAALAGLYAGIKPKFMAYGFVDFTSHVQARHFYLFSADGQVCRCYDNPPGGGDWRHFDFDSAAREDPGNSGRFAVRGNELYIKMGGPQAEEITTTITTPGLLEINTVHYTRQE
jgi:hypothetical protein